MARRRTRKWTMYIAALIAVMIALSMLLLSIYLRGKELGDADVKRMHFGIKGDACNLTVELQGFEEVDVKDDSLSVSFGAYSLPLEHEGCKVKGVLNRTHFLALSDEDSATISGKALALDTPIWDLWIDLDVDVDVTFIHTLARSITVTEINVLSVEEGNMSIHLGIEADLTREVEMDMENVTGQVTSEDITDELTVTSLRLDPDGSGDAFIMVNTASILTLFISTRPITLSAWGFEMEVNG